MDFASDRGEGWREDITEQLINIGFDKKQILNPCSKRKILTHPYVGSDEGTLIKKHRDEKNWKAIESVMKDIAHVDLRMVDKSDIIIVNLPSQGDSEIIDNNERFFQSYGKLWSIENSDEIMNLRRCYLELYNQRKESSVPVFGTLHEIVVARQQKKPVFLIHEGGLQKLSAWLMWLIGHENVFSTIDECVNHLKDILSGKIKSDCEDWMILE